MLYVIYIVAALGSTLAGSLSGMGGGIIMKPVFDLLGQYSAGETAVLTSCSMLAMSLVSVLSEAKRLRREKRSAKIVCFVACGSLLGGLIGDKIFTVLTERAPDRTVKIVQTVVLIVMVTLIIFYMLGKKRTLGVKKEPVGILVGLALGVVSAFLGIGGGPLNVAVLTLVFGMGAKEATTCSLASVLVAQGTKTAAILVRGGLAAFSIGLLPFVVLAGVCGALIGRQIKKKIDDPTVYKIFIAIQGIVLVMCVGNIVKLAVGR